MLVEKRQGSESVHNDWDNAFHDDLRPKHADGCEANSGLGSAIRTTKAAHDEANRSAHKA